MPRKRFFTLAQTIEMTRTIKLLT